MRLLCICSAFNIFSLSIFEHNFCCSPMSRFSPSSFLSHHGLSAAAAAAAAAGAAGLGPGSHSGPGHHGGLHHMKQDYEGRHGDKDSPSEY